MPSSRTPWKKSRTLGDAYGGRVRRRMTDGIFERLHSLTPPGPHDARPITLVDNPSGHFVFPTTVDRLVDRIHALPDGDGDGITHLWLRRRRPRDRDDGFAEFVCGSGVRLVVIHPWPADLLLRFGPRRPSHGQLRRYEPWTTDLRLVGRTWCLAWEPDAVERFTLDHVLLHEVGHHLDAYRHRWTAASRRQDEHRADSYAARWTATGADQLP